ncbi:MAG TPA: SPOR domain-containing protein [Gammaproteobacteria bacterium]
MNPFKRLRIFICAALCLACAAASARADDFALGMQALETGNAARAIELWRPLAESGNVDAQFALGVIYNDGMGMEQDYLEANYWFLRAAEQNLPAAQYNLGNAYKNGTGMTTDPKMAVLWWRKAAEQDFGPAQFNLGSALLEGLGTPRDADEGLRWYRKAAANGHPHAQQYLDELQAKSPAAPQPPPSEPAVPRGTAVEASEINSAAPVTAPAVAADAVPAADTRAETAPVAPQKPVAGTAPPATTAARHDAGSAAAATAQAGTSLSAAPADCGDWLDRDAHTHTLQLLSSQEPDDARQYAARHALGDTAVCSYLVKGRRWHALLLGRYASAAAARGALADLPAPVRADGAYVRRIAEIRAAVNR